MQSAHATVGLWGHLWVQKWSKMIFFKSVSRPIGVLEQVVQGHFEPSWTHMSLCKLKKKALKSATLGLTVHHRMVHGECGRRVDR